MATSSQRLDDTAPHVDDSMRRVVGIWSMIHEVVEVDPARAGSTSRLWPSWICCTRELVAWPSHPDVCGSPNRRPRPRVGLCQTRRWIRTVRCARDPVDRLTQLDARRWLRPSRVHLGPMPFRSRLVEQSPDRPHRSRPGYRRRRPTSQAFIVDRMATDLGYAFKKRVAWRAESAKQIDQARRDIATLTPSPATNFPATSKA